MKHSTSLPNNKPIRILIFTAFWLGLWTLVSQAVDQILLIPSPAAVLLRFLELAATGGFWRSALTSLIRIFSGLLAGTCLGCLLAVLTYCSGWADLLLSPAIRIIRSTPVASFIILLLLWLRTGLVPCAIAGLMVLPVVWENVSSGLHSVDPLLLELSRVYHFSPSRRIRYVYLPAIRPHFISGVCTSIGLAWKSGIAAEVLCLPKAAIGTQVYYSKIYLETPSLFAWTGLVILLSFLLETLVRKILKRYL